MSLRLTSIHRALLALILLLALSSVSPASVPAAPAAPPSGSLAAARTLSALGPKDGRVQELLAVGQRAFYIAAYDAENRFELYSTPLAGGAPARLSAGLPKGQVEDMEAAGDRLVFSYRLDNSGQHLLYSVPIAGGVLVQLTPEYVDASLGAGEFGFFVSGTRVVYSVAQERSGVPLLYSVPVVGGAVTRLSPDLPDPGPGLAWRVRSVRDSDDKGTVVFTMALPGNSTPQLYASPVAGGGASLLSGTAALASVELSSFNVTPNGSRVVYRSPTGSGVRLVSVTSAGGDLQELSPSGFTSVLITPDSARAVFLVPGSGGVGADLVSTPVAGGAQTPLGSAGNAQFALSPSGTEVYFTPTTGGLQRVPVVGGAPVTVLATLTADLSTLRFAGTRAFFTAGPFDNKGLFVSEAGGVATRIDDSSVTAGGIFALEVAPDGSVAYYTASSASGQPIRLYRVAAGGGASLKLNPDAPAASPLTLIQDVDDTGAVLFTQGASSGQGLPPSGATIYRVGATAALPATIVDSSRAIVGDVTSYAVSEPDNRAVYVADQETAGVPGLYSVAVSGGAPVKLNSAEQSVISFTISPVGGRVVYLANTVSTNTVQLFSVPIGGGTPAPVGDPVSNELIRGVRFTPDGATLFYHTGNDNFPEQPGTLLRAPAAGGAAAIVSTNVLKYALAAEAGRVLYVTEGFPDQLSSVPITGGDTTPLGSFGNGGETTLFAVGARVIYSPSGPFGGTNGIVSQPINGGSATPLFTEDPSFTPGNVRLSADGAFVFAGSVLSRTNLNDPLLLQLRRAPIAGGEATVLVERSFPAEYSSNQVSFAFEQAPAGGPLVFSVTDDIADPSLVRHTLGSVPVTGGTATTLFGPADLGSVSLPFLLSADGAQVLFRAGADLYRVPATGGTVVKLSAGGFVGEFGFGSDGAALFVEGPGLYRAPAGAPATRVDGLPAGTFASLGKQVGDLLVFTGTRDFVSTPSASLSELYATSVIADPKPFKLRLPLLRK